MVNRLRRAEQMTGVAIHRSAAPNFNHMTINGTSPILGDVNVRKALLRAINRDTIAKMKPGVRIINAARGALVDESALAPYLDAALARDLA